MRLPSAIIAAATFLAALTSSCSGELPCGPETCFGCCSPEGFCSPCDLDGGTAGGQAGGGTGVGGGQAGGDVGGGGGATGGGSSAGGGSAGGTAGGGGAAGGGAAGAGGGSGVCTNGSACAPAGGGSGVCCANTCKAISTDVENCGGCGVGCPAGSTCSQGRCSVSCDGGTCPSGTACSTNSNSVLACYPTQCTQSGTWCSRGAAYAGQCCGSGCVDVFNDPNNCGSCGYRCAAGHDCFYGSCTPHQDCATAPAGSQCRADGGAGFCCGGQCGPLNTTGDRDNCGGCGLHCPVGEQCLNSQCAKPDAGVSTYCAQSTAQCAPGTSCNTNTTRCVTESCSPSTFGMPCSGTGGANVCCNAGCVDLSADPNNCSACGHACGAGNFCDQGSCRPTPTCGLSNSGVDCPAPGGGLGKCCGSTCVNPRSSATNCGACGVQCPSGEGCQQGVCHTPDGGYLGCTGIPGACPQGTMCDGAKCVPLSCPAGSSGETCEFGVGVGNTRYQSAVGRCCNGACVDVTQDPRHCSACGASCPSGLCIAPGLFQSFLGASCYAPPSSNCQVTCPADMFCAGGRCNAKTCTGPGGGTCLTSLNATGQCCNQGFITSCINPSNDPANCGGCGISCGAGATCTNGVCSTSAPPCGAGHLGQFCNLDAGLSNVCCPGGGCTDTSTDPKNCGNCGNVCSAGLSCVTGKCVALTCTTGTQNQSCQGDAGSPGTCCGLGCVDRRTDVANCGSCGRVCVAGETCAGGACGLDACDALSQGSICHRDAGTQVTTGQCCSSACLDTDRDRNNCGGCNRVCPGDAGCTNGNCQ